MRYLVTGATGYVGAQFVRRVAEYPEAEVVAVVRDEKRARRILPVETELFPIEDLAVSGVLDALQGPVDYIVHCAAVTQSWQMKEHPVETADSIVLTTREVLRLARRKRVQAMVFVSSMEVYGALDSGAGRTTEASLGAVNLLKARSSYPMGKRMAEQYCYDYFAEYGVPVRIARLAQTFGRGVPMEDGRVYAQFAKAAGRGEDLVLHTTGMSMGNYCAIDDVLNALEVLLQSGADGEAYNVVNEENTMRIREMAELVAGEFSNGRSQVVYDIPEGKDFGYAAETGLRLSGEKLRSLGWRPRKNLMEMYRDMIESWHMGGGNRR